MPNLLVFRSSFSFEHTSSTQVHSKGLSTNSAQLPQAGSPFFGRCGGCKISGIGTGKARWRALCLCAAGCHLAVRSKLYICRLPLSC